MKDWLLEQTQKVFEYLIDILLFLPRFIFDFILQILSYVINWLSPPEFLSEYTISDYIHEDIAWLLYMSGFDISLGIIGSAIVFKLVRRLMTLGIW